MTPLRRLIAALCLTMLAAASFAAKPGKVEPLMIKQLADFRAKRR